MVAKRKTNNRPPNRSASGKTDGLGKANFAKPIQTRARSLPKYLSKDTKHLVLPIEIITMPLDRLHLILRDHLGRSQRRINWRLLTCAVSLFAGSLTVVTVDLHGGIGLPKLIFGLFLYALLGLSLVLLGMSLAGICTRSDIGKEADNIIDGVKSKCKVALDKSTKVDP